MAYNLETIRNEDHILARLTGERTRDTVSSAGRIILDSCREHQVEKVLVDVRKLEGRLSVFDSLMLIMEEFPRLQQARVLKKAAIVDSVKRLERISFFESIARRRGFNIRTFTSMDSARDWLARDD